MAANIILIGSSGRVGQMVGAAWRTSHHPWRNAPFQTRRSEQSTHTDLLVWEPREGVAALQRWIETYGELSAVVVLAGTTPATGSDMDVNVDIAKLYLEAAQLARVPRVLLASSSAVYGFGVGTPLSESSICKPANAYGVSKRKMEQAAEPYKQAGLDVCCLRIGNVSGADAMLLNAPAATPNSPIQIDQFPDGKGPLRSYIGPETLGRCLGQLANYVEPLPFLLNVAAPTPVHMESLAHAASLPWEYRIANDMAKQHIFLNCERLCQLIDMPYSKTANPQTITQEWLELRSK